MLNKYRLLCFCVSRINQFLLWDYWTKKWWEYQSCKCVLLQNIRNIKHHAL